MQKRLFLSVVLAGLFLLSGCTLTAADQDKPNDDTVFDVEKETNNTDPQKNEDAQNREIINDDPSLEQTSFFDGKVDILMPKGFSPMAKDMVKSKYPNGSDTMSVYTNEATTVNFAIEHTTNRVKESQIPFLGESTLGILRTQFPSLELIDADTIDVAGKPTGYIEIITPAVDTNIYNLMWFTEVDGTVLMFTFNCTVDQQDEWQPRAHKILESFRVN